MTGRMREGVGYRNALHLCLRILTICSEYKKITSFVILCWCLLLIKLLGQWTSLFIGFNDFFIQIKPKPRFDLNNVGQDSAGITITLPPAEKSGKLLLFLEKKADFWFFYFYSQADNIHFWVLKMYLGQMFTRWSAPWIIRCSWSALLL